MKLTFLGTRGEIDARTRRHRRHTSTRIGYRGRAVVVDCGADWLGRLGALQAQALVLTHAHPDHVGGLRDGAPCPVWATAESWELMARWPIAERRVVRARTPFEVCGIRFEAFPVEHSLRAPAVGYRVQAGRVTIFYVPDLVYIHDRAAALAGVSVYVGDGATLTRPFIRRRGDHLIGHAPVRDQLGWCAAEGVPRAIITHCGTEIVAGDERRLGARLRALGHERGVRAEMARDGMEVVLRRSGDARAL